MEKSEITDVIVSTDGGTITFRFADGAERKLKSGYGNMLYPATPANHVSIALASALLTAHDRMDDLERRINSLEG